MFKVIFNTQIKPLLECERVDFDTNERIRSRAFRRFLIGQSSLFSRYPTPLNLGHIPTTIFSRLQSDSDFSASEQNEMRSLIYQYIRGVEGLRMISREESLNASDCSTVFPAVFISYPAMQEKYGSIEACVQACIVGYTDPEISMEKTVMPGAGYMGLFAQKSIGSLETSPRIDYII